MEELIEGQQSGLESIFSQENLSLLLDQVTSPILWLDNKHALLRLNHAAKKLFRWSDQVIGQSFPMLCAKDKIDCPLNHLRTNSDCVLDLNKNNKTLIIKWKLTPLLDKEHYKQGLLLMGEDITESLTIKQKYEHIQSYYGDIMRSLPSIVYWKDCDGVYQGGNYEAISLSGALERGDFVGKTDFDFSERLGWDPGVVEKFRADDVAVTDSKQARYQLEELPFKRPDGSLIYEISNKAPWLDKRGNLLGVVGVSLDITDLVNAEKEIKVIAQNKQIIIDKVENDLGRMNRKLTNEVYVRRQIEQELRKSEQRYKMLSAISPVGIFHLDINGICRYVNPQGCDILGRTENMILNQYWFRPIRDKDFKPILAEWRRSLAADETFKMEFRIITPSGEVRRVFGQCIADKSPDGEVKGFVGTVTDLTKLREAETIIRNHQLKLAHVSRVNTIGEMASGIAHELNQPLTSIVQYIGGCIKRLQDDGLSDTIISALERATQQAERAGKIIHRMKNFLRKGESYKTLCDVNHIITEVLNIMHAELADSQILVKLNLSPNMPAVKLDQIQIEQVIINISYNAIEVMRTQQAKQQQLTINTNLTSDNAVQIVIQDTGPGIPVESQTQIFNPFYTTKPNGMGIGLSLAYSIVQAHGGRLWVESTLNQGSQFYIKLPVEKEGRDDECNDLFG